MALSTPILGKSVVSAWSTGREAGRAGGLQEVLSHQLCGSGQVSPRRGQHLLCGLTSDSGPSVASSLSLLTWGSPPVWAKPTQLPLPPQEGGGPAVPSGGGVHHQGRPGGNSQRHHPGLLDTPGPALVGQMAMRSRQQFQAPSERLWGF